MTGLLYRYEAYILISNVTPYEESRQSYRYTKLSDSFKQVNIDNQNHIVGQKQVDKTTLPKD